MTASMLAPSGVGVAGVAACCPVAEENPPNVARIAKAAGAQRRKTRAGLGVTTPPWPVDPLRAMSRWMGWVI